LKMSLEISEREAELRRRNEEIEIRQAEAVRIARDIIQTQEAKLATSPSQCRSARRNKVFDNSSDSQRFLSDDNSDHRQSLESVPSPSKGDFPDRHWNSRTSDEHRKTDRTQPISESSSQNPAHNAERHQLHAEVDDVKDIGGNMGLEATVRYLKAKLKAVTAELDTCVQLLREKETALNEQTKLRAELEASNIKSSSALASLKTKMDKMKHELDEKNKQAEGLERQLAAAVHECDALRRTRAKDSAQESALDARLHRAVEEAERWKRAAAEAKEAHAADAALARKRLDQAVSERGRATKERNEVLKAFKKQQQVADLLRRQVMHLQAAKLLQLSEADLTLALEQGERA